MTAEVDICNLALQKLGVPPIASLSENSTAARECDRVYTHARDSELRRYHWNFARDRKSIAASGTSPAFGYSHKYQLPADWLRLITDTTTTDWQIEGRYILTNDSGPLQILYIKRVTDPNEFDELFIELLACRIAKDTCEKLTQSNSKKENAHREYNLATAEAKRINSFENKPKQAPVGSWDTARL